MQIEFDQKFKINLQIILEHIAKDKLSDSKKYKKHTKISLQIQKIILL